MGTPSDRPCYYAHGPARRWVGEPAPDPHAGQKQEGDSRGVWFCNKCGKGGGADSYQDAERQHGDGNACPYLCVFQTQEEI
jgi:hypothetical protein